MSETCVCGHGHERHPNDRGVLGRESACMDCACAGFTIEPRCDFCSGFPVVWTYPTRQQAMEVIHLGPGGGSTTHVSHAGWACCDACSTLIEADDRDALARRLPMADLHPSERGAARAKVKRAHRIQFFDARTGPRIPESGFPTRDSRLPQHSDPHDCSSSPVWEGGHPAGPAEMPATP